MPLVNISVRTGTAPAFRRALADGVHDAMMEALGIPADDRFQLIHEFEPQSMLHDPRFLGVARSDRTVFVQIFVNVRPREQKETMYRLIVRNLATDPGVAKEDVFIGVVEVAPENWWAFARP